MQGSGSIIGDRYINRNRTRVQTCNIFNIPSCPCSHSFIVEHLGRERKVSSLQEKMYRDGRCRSHPPCLLVLLLEVTILFLLDPCSLVLPRRFSKFPKNNSSANTHQPQNDGNIFISMSLKGKQTQQNIHLKNLQEAVFSFTETKGKVFNFAYRKV